MASWGHSEMAALQDICREAPDAGLRAAQTSVVARVGPAAVGADAPAGAAPATSGADPKAIWDDDEIPPEEALSFLDAGSDPRPRAKFSMLYKQAVATEDVYLGTEKTPGSCHSNALVYRVEFPDHALRELDLDVTKTTLSASSSRLRLALYLPQPVLADHASAAWDDRRKLLSVTLPVDSDDW